MGTPPPDVEPLPLLYTTRKEIDSVFSQMGVQFRLDDKYSDTGPDDVLEDIIVEATDEVNTYVEWRYQPEDLYKSRWVRRRCSWIAAHLLSQRRGNPKQMVGRYKTAIKDLERVLAGEFNIPRLNWRDDFAPGYSNLTVDHRFPDAPQVIGTQHRTIGWF